MNKAMYTKSDSGEIIGMNETKLQLYIDNLVADRTVAIFNENNQLREQVFQLQAEVSAAMNALVIIKENVVGESFNRWDLPTIITRRRAFIADTCDYVLDLYKTQPSTTLDDRGGK